MSTLGQRYDLNRFCGIYVIEHNIQSLQTQLWANLFFPIIDVESFLGPWSLRQEIDKPAGITPIYNMSSHFEQGHDIPTFISHCVGWKTSHPSMLFIYEHFMSNMTRASDKTTFVSPLWWLETMSRPQLLHIRHLLSCDLLNMSEIGFRVIV